RALRCSAIATAGWPMQPRSGSRKACHGKWAAKVAACEPRRTSTCGRLRAALQDACRRKASRGIIASEPAPLIGWGRSPHTVGGNPPRLRPLASPLRHAHCARHPCSGRGYLGAGNSVGGLVASLCGHRGLEVRGGGEESHLAVLERHLLLGQRGWPTREFHHDEVV